jgi:rubrerythrin
MAATRLDTGADRASPLAAGVKVTGEYLCVSCGYGVTVYRELPRCPMCGSGSWEQLAWSRVARSLEDGY